MIIYLYLYSYRTWIYGKNVGLIEKGYWRCSWLVFRHYFRGDRCGMPFLLCKSFFGFKMVFTRHALISSVDSATEIDDDSISLVLISRLWFSFHGISLRFDSESMNLQHWLLSSIGTIETWKVEQCDMFKSCKKTNERKCEFKPKQEGISFTLQAIEQKRLGKSCMYLPQASQVPPNFNFVDGFESFDCGRGHKWTAFSPFIL